MADNDRIQDKSIHGLVRGMSKEDSIFLRMIVDDLAFLGEVEQLPELTHRQLNYVIRKAKGSTTIEAFKASYDTEGRTSYASIVSGAAAVQNSPRVQAWLQAIKQGNVFKGLLSVEEHMAELERLKNGATRKGDYASAIRAEHLRGKVAGHYIERIQHIDGMTDQDLFKAINSLFGAEFEARAREMLGYKSPVDKALANPHIKRPETIDLVPLSNAEGEPEGGGGHPHGD